MSLDKLKGKALHDLAVAEYAEDYIKAGYKIEEPQKYSKDGYTPDLVVFKEVTNQRIYLEFKLQRVAKNLTNFNRFKQHIIKTEPQAEIKLIIINEDYKSNSRVDFPDLKAILTNLINIKYSTFYKYDEQSTGNYNLLATIISEQILSKDSIIITGEGELEYEVKSIEEKSSSIAFVELAFDFNLVFDGRAFFTFADKYDALRDSHINFDFN